MTTMLQTILSFSGKPGLYKLVSRAKNTLIVEALDETHRRIPAFATDKVSSLSDISIYTETGDVPLHKVLTAIGELEQTKPCSMDYRKASGDKLRNYLAKALPDFDRDRVHVSDIKKLLQWYDILVNNGITAFDEELAPTEGDNIDNRLEATDGQSEAE